MLPNVVLFEGEDSSGHYQLWETNGTAAGTIELTGIGGTFASGLGPVALVPYTADEVLFGGAGANGLYGLWETNGTAAGTNELTGIAGAATTGAGLYPSNFTIYNGEVLFTGYDSSGKLGLWITNGTGAGTHELAVAGASTTSQGLLLAGLNPSDLTVHNGYVFFSGDDASGRVGLWETNGTAAGTYELSVAGVATVGQDLGPAGLDPSDLTVFNDQMLFSGNDARSQTGLWVTNGTAAGTHEVTGIAGASTAGVGLDPSDLTVYNGEVLFSGIGSSGLYGLWVTNGTAAGTHELTGIAGEATTGPGLLPQNLTNFNGEILFAGRDSSGLYGLWVTNGTAAGTHELTGIAGAQTSGVGLDPFDFAVYNGEALFTGYDSSGKLGLWVTNGTVAGTHELTGLTGAAGTGLAPSDLTSVGGPVLTAGAGVKYVAGGTPVTLDAGLSISDSESTSLIGATVSIGAGFLTGDMLSVASPQTGIASSYNAATGVLTFTGTANLATYETELDLVTFASPSATNPSRTITWSVDDGVTTSAPASSSVSVVANPPVLTAGAGVKYVAGGTPVTLDAGLSISDSELTSLIGATVSIGAGFLTGDMLSVASPQTGIASSYNAATGVLTFTGTANLATYETELDLVTFASPSATNPSCTITWSVDDGVTTSTPASSSLLVSSVDPSTTTALPPPNFFSSVAEAGILWQNSDGDVELWNPNGSGGFTYDNLGAVNSSWQIRGTGDFNGSGEASILWCNANGDTELWNSNGSGGFTYKELGIVDTSWQIAGTGDFNGSGEAGLLWRNSTNGDIELWNPNGSGGFTYDNVGVVNTSWQIAGSGDFNGSGEAGILWRNTNGNVEIWNSNGSGGFTYDSLGSVNSSWQIAGTGDFNGDGADDILWRNSTNGDVELWNSNGSGRFTYDNLGATNSSWQIAGTGDFTGTGQDSILWRNAAGDTELWNPNGLGGFTYDNLGVVSTSWSIHKIFA